jgi:membrane-associated PAP2 superfamily phosphatase
MNQTGLICALAIAAVVGLLFGIAPELELWLSRPWFEILYLGQNFGLRFDAIVQMLRQSGVWLVALLAVPPALALVLKVLLPGRRSLIPARAIVFLLTTLALAPGMLANVALKDHWGRPRPIDVSQFGGSETYVRWWDPRGDCPKNCSFVSGDVSGAYWTLAPAALAPPSWRPLAYAGALAVGVAMSVLRMAAGAHFITDVVFAGVFTFLIIWIMHGLIYRWPRTRLSDEGVERAIDGAVLPPHNFVRRLFRQVSRP